MNCVSGLSRIAGSKHPLAVLLLTGLAVRLVLMPLFSFNIDICYWMKAFNLIDAGQNLYGIDGYYYTPVWGYVLGVMDAFAHVLGMTDYGTYASEFYPYVGRDYSIASWITSISFNVMVKIPLILTDLAIGYLMYAFADRITGDRKKAVAACAFWMFCPLTILESSMHGMFDNISAMFMLMAFITAYDRKYIFAGGTFALAVLTKFFPVFFIFLLVAMVFRNEGINAKALGKVGTAVLSAVVVLVIVEIPAIINGQFWDSLSFLTGRIGLSVEFMESVTGPLTWVLLAVLVAAVCAASYYLAVVRPDIVRSRFLDVPSEVRDRTVRRLMVRITLVMTALVLAYSVYSVMRSDMFTFVDLFNTIGKRIVMLLSIYTLILEAYIAYRFLFTERKGHDAYLFAFMLSSAVIFLWPPAPQYVVVIIPALALYAAVSDGTYVKPFFALGALVALYDIILAGPSPLFSLAAYTDLLTVSSLVPSVEFVTSYIFGGIPTIGLFMAVFGVLAYLSVINILYVWYKHRKEVTL